MATVFHGDAAIRRGFGVSTLSGLALYLLIYSLLGAGFAAVVRDRFTGLGTRAAGRALFGGLVLPVVSRARSKPMPLVWLLHAESSTVLGHVIFGVLMARFPAYLPKLEQAPVANRPRRNRSQRNNQARLPGPIPT